LYTIIVEKRNPFCLNPFFIGFHTHTSASKVKTVITTTPRYEGRSFGINMLKAALTAYAGKGRRLSDEELNGLIEEVGVRPGVVRM
jgi:hypothetical protein